MRRENDEKSYTVIIIINYLGSWNGRIFSPWNSK
jgi:hypothetical protein